MADPSTFEVNIRTTADTSGATEAEAAIARVKKEAEAANAGGAGTSGLAGAAAVANDTEIVALQKEQAATMQAILSGETAISAEKTAQTAAQERLASLTTQRQILVDLELEQTQALAAGDTARAAGLEAQITLKQAALQLQTGAQLSEEESLTIAQARITAEAEIAAAIAAQSEGSLLAGVNIGRARQEATVLGRELLTGGNTTRTLGSLLGSLGPYILAAAGASVAFYEALKGVNALAQTLGVTLSGGLDPETVAKEITALDKLKQALADIDKQSFKDLSAELDKSGQKITELTDKYREAMAQTNGLLEPFLHTNQNLQLSLEAQLAAEVERKSLLEFSANVAQALETLEAEKTAELKNQQEVLKAVIALQNEGVQLAQKFKEAEQATLSDQDKLDTYKTRVEAIKSAIEGYGVSATTAHEAEQKTLDPAIPQAQKNEIIKLATEWTNLGGEIVKTQAQVNAFNAQTAALRQTILTSTDVVAVQKAADELKKLNDQATSITKLPAPSPSQGLEKFLLDTIANANSSTAQINQMKSALAQLYLEQAAAPKPFIPPTGPAPEFANLPNQNGEVIVPAAGPAAAKAAGPSLDQSLDALQQKLDQRNQEIEAVAPVIQTDIPKSIDDTTSAITKGFDDISVSLQTVVPAIAPLFAPIATSISTDIPKAIQDGTDQLTAAVVAGVGNLSANFSRQADDLQKQINALWQAL
jgi:hypothetical protein